MLSIGSITFKNQLTIPKQIIERLGLERVRKVLIFPQSNGFLVKPIVSSVELLAGSLAKKSKLRVSRKKERELSQKLVAREIAREGLK